MKFLREFLEVLDWGSRAEKELKPNESTMESKQKDDKKNVPKKVKVVVEKILKVYRDQQNTGYAYQTVIDTLKVSPQDSLKTIESYENKMDSILNQYEKK